MRPCFYLLCFIQLVTFKISYSSSFEEFRNNLKQELGRHSAEKMIITTQTSNTHLVNVTFCGDRQTISCTQLKANFLHLVNHIPEENTRKALKAVLQENNPGRNVTINSTHIFTVAYASIHSFQHSHPANYKPIQ